jgi:hypothetical protein
LTFNALPTSSKCLIFNAFMHLKVLGGWVKGRVLSKVDKQGVGWVVLCYRMFFAKVQETEKPPKSHRKDNRKALNP